MYGYVSTAEYASIRTVYTAYAAQFERDYYFDGEQHDFWEMVIVLEGSLGVTAGSDVFVLHKGQAVLHAPLEFHRLWSEGNSAPQIIIFSFSLRGMPEVASKIFEIKDLKKPLEILDKMRKSYEFSGINVVGIKNETFPENQTVIKELEIFLLEVLAEGAHAREVKKSHTAENYARIIEVMEKNTDKNLSVYDIAVMCRMSEVNLKKTFSRYSGMGVMVYFNRMKIARAVTMIANGVSVKEAAAALGFSNQNYFSTVFKRITGNPPTYYK